MYFNGFNSTDVQVPFDEEEHSEMSDDHQQDLQHHTEDQRRSSCGTSAFQNVDGSEKGNNVDGNFCH